MIRAITKPYKGGHNLPKGYKMQDGRSDIDKLNAIYGEGVSNQDLTVYVPEGLKKGSHHFKTYKEFNEFCEQLIRAGYDFVINPNWEEFSMETKTIIQGKKTNPLDARNVFGDEQVNKVFEQIKEIQKREKTNGQQ